MEIKVNKMELLIESKNRGSIKKFLVLCFKNKLLNCKIIKALTSNLNIKKITILKSPHVNKKAQEQFENRLIKKRLEIQTTKNLKYLLFLKKLNSKLFPDIQIKIKSILTNKEIKKLKIFTPRNFKINECFNLILKNKAIFKHLVKKKIIFLLKIFDIFGENIKTEFKNSCETN